MNKFWIQRLGVAAIASLALADPQSARAGAQHVTVTAGALSGAGVHYVEFTLTDGSGTGNGDGFAGVSNFLVSGGTLGAVAPPTLGDVTGGLGGANTLSLTDTNAGTGGLADFAQGFTITDPNATISFDLTLTDTGVEPITPDAFTFQLLDGTFTAIATTGPVGTELVSADYTSADPSATGFMSDGVFEPAIVATLAPVTGVPEPSALVPFALGALSLGGLMLRGRRRAPAA